MTDRVSLYDRLPLLTTEAWWLDRAERAAGGRILELGAATGRLTLALASRGLHVTAVERDPAMAARLTERTAAVRERVTVQVADATRLELEQLGPHFGLVALPTALVNEVEDVAARRALLHAARRCCHPDGHVALQLLSPWWLSGLAARSVGTLQPADGEGPIEVEILDRGFAPATGRRRARLTYRFPDGARFDDDLDAAVITPGELDLLLADAGLVRVELVGAHPPDGVAGTDPVWHVLAQPTGDG